MRSIRRAFQGLIVTGLVFTAGAGAAQTGISATAADEQAIYHTILSSWLDGSRGKQMVDRRLGAPPSLSDNAECVKGLHFSDNATGSLKTLDAASLGVPNVELVDGQSWRADDPEHGMAHGKSVDDAVKAAFAHSLFSFSQIEFTTDGQDALVSFGMVCGSLCGHGETLHMHKSDGYWKEAGGCGSWES